MNSTSDFKQFSRGIYWNFGKSGFVSDDFNASLHGGGWQREFASLKAVGIDTLVFFNADLLTLMPMMREVFTVAEKLGFRIFMECGNRKNGRNFPVGEGVFEDTVDTIWRNFGSSPSFAGWYLFAEMNLAATAEKYHEYFKGWAEYCKKVTPDKPVMISPFYAPALHPPIMEYGDNGPEVYFRYWDTVLTDTPIDILSLQDNGGQHFSFFTDAVNEPYIAAFADVCRRHGVHFYGNVEMGEFVAANVNEFVENFGLEHSVNDPICRHCWHPTPIGRLREKFRLMNKYSEANFSWGFREFYRESLENGCYRAYKSMISNQEL